MHSRLRFLFVALAALALAPRAVAQDSLGLVCDTPLLDGRDLRAAVEQELKVPVRLLQQPSGPSLLVEADALDAVHVRFVRMDQPSVERTVDVSAQAPQAVTFIAIVAANLARDEASELLTQLGAAPPAPPPAEELPPPPAAAISVPAPAPTPQIADRSPKPHKPLSLACMPNRLRKVMVGADVFPYLGTSMRDSVNVERRFSFNLFGGITGAVRGLELAGLFNIEAETMCGFQLSGVFNYVQSDVSGVQLSMLNIAGGNLVGAQLGQVNIAGADVYGAQLGEVNVAGGDVSGVQIGLVEVTGGRLYGVQLGLANVSARGLVGWQAGLANVSAGPMTGKQIGLLNVIAGEAHGVQIGLVNASARRERGALIGLVNAAENADAAIGLLNVLWRGRTQLDVWATDAGLLMLGVEHGARITHNVYGLGIKPMSGSPALSATFGFGLRVLHAGPLSVDIDALAYGLMRHDAARDRMDFASIFQLRIPLTFTFVRGVGLFVAPSVSISLAESDSILNQNLALYPSVRLTPDTQSDSGVRLWPGLSVGLRFL